MFCPWCGMQIDADATTCPSCGKEIGDRALRLGLAQAAPAAPQAAPLRPAQASPEVFDWSGPSAEPATRPAPAQAAAAPIAPAASAAPAAQAYPAPGLPTNTGNAGGGPASAYDPYGSRGGTLAQQPAAEPLPHPVGQRHVVTTANGKRTEVFLAYTGTPEQAEQAATSVLRGRGFKVKDYKGESVWKKGTGLATAMEFVKIEHRSGYLVVQAWIQIGVGSVGLSEQSLDGVVGALPKKMLSGVVDKIEKAVG